MSEPLHSGRLIEKSETDVGCEMLVLRKAEVIQMRWSYDAGTPFKGIRFAC